VSALQDYIVKSDMYIVYACGVYSTNNGLPGESFATTLLTRDSFPSYYFILFYFWSVYNWLVCVGSSSFIEIGRLKQNCSAEQLINDSESI
jgi:hypothetical protein